MNEVKAITIKLYYESLDQKKTTLIFIIIFGVLIAALVSVFIPYTSEKIQIIIVAMLSVVILKQWSAESFAAEKENNTFESILSTGINLKKLYWSQVFFNLFLVLFMESILIVLFKIMNMILKVQLTISYGEFLLMILILLQLQIFMATIATFISLTSRDVRSSASKSAKYLYIIMLFISITVTLKINNTPYLLYIYEFLLLLMAITNIIVIKYKNYKLGKIQYEDILN
ncbi:MAG: hypothetical protein WBA54_00750 [Acidaminobacteraceae bacterium]